MNDLDYIPRKAAMEKLGIKSFEGMKAFEKRHRVSAIKIIGHKFGYRLTDIRRALGEKVEPSTEFKLSPVWTVVKRNALPSAGMEAGR